MAPKTGVADQFSQIVYQSVTESAANTLTFEKFETGYGTLDRAAWIIHKIEYYVSSTDLDLIVSNGDGMRFALSRSNLISALGLDSAAVLDMMEIGIDIITAASFELVYKPLIRDFTSLPGGGFLALPNPLFVAVEGISLAAAITLETRVHFSTIQLADNQWVELVEQTRLLT